MRVVVLPSHFDGDGFYRVLFPARELAKQAGWDVVFTPHGVEQQPDGRIMVHYGLWGPEGLVESAEDWLLRFDFDVLLMQQREEPFWAPLIEKLQAQGKRVFVDSDDAWYDVPSWNPGSSKPRAGVRAMEEQLAAADGLSVATPALADLYSRFQPNVRVIRNRLDAGMWSDVTPVYERPSRRLRVGWMGDTKWRSGDLQVLRGVLGPWLCQHPEVEFVAAGDPRAHDFLDVPVGQRVSVANCHFRNMDLADITATFDIGLIPLDLRKGKTLNEGKSHLKGLEYNAAGIPFIASPSESYRWFIDNGGCGVVAATPAEWRRELDYYVSDKPARLCDAMLGREWAQEHSVQRNVGEWEDWLGADRGSHPHPARTPIAA